MFGGVEDHVVDSFGFRIPLCAENGGYTSDGRSEILNLMALNEQQPDWVPKFTKAGFKKTKIPADVFEALLSEHKRLRLHMVQESCAKAVINCEKIVIDDDVEEEYLQSSQKTFIMKPSTAVHNFIEKQLLPLAEQWADIKLVHTSTYGIR